MLKKSLLVVFAIFFSLALVVSGATTGRSVTPQASAQPNPQTDCSDEAIRAEIIRKLRDKFPTQRRNENFFFNVFSKNKVVTLKGYVPGERLRDKILDDVRNMIRQMRCGARLNRGHESDDKKDKFFRNHESHHCQTRQVECPDGSCKGSLAECENPFFG